MAMAPNANNPAPIMAMIVLNPGCTRVGSASGVGADVGVCTTSETACAVGWSVGGSVLVATAVAVGGSVAEAGGVTVGVGDGGTISKFSPMVKTELAVISLKANN
jgi:hypothetical protein